MLITTSRTVYENVHHGINKCVFIGESHIKKIPVVQLIKLIFECLLNNSCFADSLCHLTQDLALMLKVVNCDGM